MGRRAFAVWGLCVQVLACSLPSSSPDAGEDAGIVLSAVDSCDRISRARCAALSRCYPAFTREPAEQCVSHEQGRCLAQLEQLRSYFDSKTIEVDSEQVLRCEQRLLQSFCSPTFPPGYRGATSPFSDCDLTTGLLRGLIPAGQPCDEPVQCVTGTMCIKQGGACRGTCSTLPQAGEPCAFGCAPGSFCDDQGTQDPTDDRCRAPRTAGETCDRSSECATELYCAGTCRPRGKLGDRCTFDPQRLSTCEPGLACDVAPFVPNAEGTCIKPLGAGQLCRFHWSCQPGLVCFDQDFSGFPNTAPTQGQCVLPVPPGTNCSFTPYQSYVGDSCAAGSYCQPSSRKCAPIPGLGEACTPSAQSCGGLNAYCKPSGGGADVGTCTGAVSLGERCAFSVDATRTITIPCISGYCDSVTSLTCLAPNKQLGQDCQENGECLSNRCAVQQDRTMKCAPPCN